jgi:osmotically-inducible protein OsmY
MFYNRFINTALLACGLTLMGTAVAQEPDNTKANKDHATTADSQKANVNDRELTQKIRKAVVADKSLSTYAHNVKIISQNGAVTLKGPVRSDDEKKSIVAKAAEIAGGPDKVSDELTVKQ